MTNVPIYKVEKGADAFSCSDVITRSKGVAGVKTKAYSCRSYIVDKVSNVLYAPPHTGTLPRGIFDKDLRRRFFGHLQGLFNIVTYAHDGLWQGVHTREARMQNSMCKAEGVTA